MTILACDPGTHRAGVCWLNEDGALRNWRRVESRSEFPSDRISALRFSLDLIAIESRADVFVTEHLQGHGVHSAPHLDSAILELEQWARAKGLVVATYAPNVWRAGVLGRGYGAASKETTATLLSVKYPDLRAIPMGPDFWDVWDACGIAKYQWERTKTPLARALAEGELSKARRTVNRKG